MAVTDVADDVFGIQMQEDMSSFGLLTTETVANAQHSNNIARNVQVRQYGEVDPLEAAAASLVARRKPLTK